MTVVSAPASDGVRAPLNVSLSGFVCLAEFTGDVVAGVEEGVFVEADAIRTPVMVRVVCHVLPFATTTLAGGRVAVVWELESEDA